MSHRSVLQHAFAFLLIVTLLPRLCRAADEIVLRDFSVLRDVQVVELLPEGLVLGKERPGGGALVSWHEVEQLTLAAAEKKPTAEKHLKEIGEPLFRLHTRLETGDEAGLLQPAEALFPHFQDRRTPTAYLVFQSLVWGRIANGQREQAVEPWLLAFETLRSRGAKLSDLPGTRRPNLDATSALLAELEPVWFDAAAATKAFPAAEKALAKLSDPLPVGARLYVASLALAAKEIKLAEPYLEGDTGDDALGTSLQQILLAERELLQNNSRAAAERMGKLLATRSTETSSKPAAFTLEPLAWFTLGRAQLASKQAGTHQQGLLSLSKIPALWGEQAPELAAAALATLADSYEGDKILAARLREELNRQFYASWHARKLRGL